MLRPWRVLCVLVALGAVVGCGGQEPDGAAAPIATESAAVAGGEAAFVAALAAIDPGLSENPDRVVRRGENVCADLEAGKDEAAVVDSARQRFDGVVVSVDAAKAELIVAAVRKHLCLDAG